VQGFPPIRFMFEEFVQTQKPLIMRDAAAHWKSAWKWSDSNLLRAMATQSVDV